MKKMSKTSLQHVIDLQTPKIWWNPSELNEKDLNLLLKENDCQANHELLEQSKIVSLGGLKSSTKKAKKVNFK